jgi:cullin 1
MGDARNWMLFEEGWRQIEELAINPLHAKLHTSVFLISKDLMSMTDFLKVYTICYTLCNQKPNYCAVLYTRHGDCISKYLREVSLISLRTKTGELLLKEFVQQAFLHRTINRWYGKLFRYLDRCYVESDLGSVPALHASGMMKFKEIIFDHFCHEVSDVIINMINHERNGTHVDRGLIRDCISIFETMGMGSLKAYIEDFEAALLASTIQFYTHRIDVWMSTHSVTEYLAEVLFYYNCLSCLLPDFIRVGHEINRLKHVWKMNGTSQIRA